MKLKIKIGKRYLLRGGLETTPLKRANNGTNYKLKAFVKEPHHKQPSVLSWLLSGRYLANNLDHRYDIIKEPLNYECSK